MTTILHSRRSTLLCMAVLAGLFLLGGCSHKNMHEEEQQHDKDRYGYFKTRDTDDNPSDNAAMRHERRGHLRWRP